MGSVAFASTEGANKTEKAKKPNTTYVKNNKKNFDVKSHLDGLVKEGIITQAQENVAIQILSPTSEGSFQETKNKINVKLDALVTSGTITRHQKDVAIKLLTQTKDGDFKKVMNKIRVNLGGIFRTGMSQR